MPTRRELKVLAEVKLKEAEALFGSGLYEGAVYIAGYVVELALKARICRLLDVQEYPDKGGYRGAYAVHDLRQLLLLAGLWKKLHVNGAVLANWSTAVSWSPDIRYRPTGTISEQDALLILNAIRHPVNGVLRWIKNYW